MKHGQSIVIEDKQGQSLLTKVTHGQCFLTVDKLGQNFLTKAKLGQRFITKVNNKFWDRHEDVFCFDMLYELEGVDDVAISEVKYLC